ncbi:MAG: PAS domain S-box protein [Ardenticatenaceae bacterium]|nr:PAS domain S-box protein [Ardenticatenaceae bacterium]MCB8986949.1 PAS domain S-box protein [Ardenticatenaceae bacterium]
MNNAPAQPHLSRTECQELLASVPDAALVVNSQGIILAANATATQLFGYASADLEGKALDLLLPERFRGPHREHVAHYFSRPWPRPMGLNLDLIARHKSGREIDILVSLAPWQSVQGAVTAVFIRDITAQKALETAVREARDRLELEVETRTAELLQANQHLREEILERQRVETELRQLTTELTRRQAELERELQSLENYSQSKPSAVTARAYNLLSLAESAPEFFAGLTQEYEVLLEKALEARMYRVENDLSAKLRRLAEKLGSYSASPHDVVQLHSRALTAKVKGIPYPRANVYFEEGRLLLLELMGHLTAYYRSYYLNVWQGKSPGQEATPNKTTTRED